jgi:hypothetical protein
LLVAEDVHWFDPSTREVLGSMLKASQGRLLVIITGRDGAWLPAEWPVKVFDLAPLTDEQTDELVMALDPTLTAEDRAAVRDRCDGVPFYVEQVVAGLEAVRADGARVPEALYEPLFARLRASPDVVPVVEAAAVIGRNVDRGLLLAVLGLEENQVDDARRTRGRACARAVRTRRLAVSPRIAARGRRRAGPAQCSAWTARQGGRRLGRRRGR